MLDKPFRVELTTTAPAMPIVAMPSAPAITITAPIASGETSRPDVVRDCPDCPLMRYVPPGWVRTDEVVLADRASTEKAKVDGFYIGETDISIAEYREFAASKSDLSSQCMVSGLKKPGSVDFGAEMPGSWDKPPIITQADDHPVVCVSPYDVSRYISWLIRRTKHKYRLPTQAEWLYVASELSTKSISEWTRVASGKEACKFANYLDKSFAEKKVTQLYTINGPYDCVDGYPFTSPVRAFPPNKLGIHDLFGNVFQYVTCDRPRFGCRPLPIIGSSWMATLQLEGVTQAKRANLGAIDWGFRVVREVE